MSSSHPASARPDPPAAPGQRPLSRDEDRQWAAFAHLGAVLFFVPALVILLSFGDRGRFTRAEATEALNMQVTLALAYVSVNLFGLALALTTPIGGGVFALITWLLWVAGVTSSVFGFMSAKDGIPYRYPVTLRLIR